jgi:hypothetical protein
MPPRLIHLVPRFACCWALWGGLCASSLLHAQDEFLVAPDNFGAEACIDCGDAVAFDPAMHGDRPWWPGWDQLGIRHSATHGRAFGRGGPLAGTSWLNRPYDFGLETGAFVMTERFSTNSSRNNDVLAAAHLGWDWDHYWGTQFRLGWTTPELSSSVGSNQRHSNNLLTYDLSMMYYPWGDSRARPYYRIGLGLTDVDFTNPAGVREDNTLFTVPVAMGIKYQTKRWMAFRAEAADHIVYGQNSASGVHNITLTFGLDWRFGGRPSGNWSSPGNRQTW